NRDTVRIVGIDRQARPVKPVGLSLRPSPPVRKVRVPLSGDRRVRDLMRRIPAGVLEVQMAVDVDGEAILRDFKTHAVTAKHVHLIGLTDPPERRVVADTIATAVGRSTDLES